MKTHWPKGTSKGTGWGGSNTIKELVEDGGRPGKPIELLCRRTQVRTGGKPRTGLEIVVVDQGAAVDRKKLCGRSLDDVRPGGLGLHFIQEGVDVMQYTSQAHRNRLRLVKYLPAAESKSKIAKGE